MQSDDKSLPFDESEPVYGEALDDPLHSVVASIPERHANLIHFPPIEIYAGDYVRVIAKISQIYRHVDHTYHHTRLELLYCKRGRKSGPYTVIRKAALDGAALEILVANLACVPRLKEISEAAQSILLPLQATAATLSKDVMKGLAAAVAVLLGSQHGKDAITQGLLTPETLDNLGAAAQHARFKRAAAELRELIIDAQNTEHVYQRWFETRPWVFGTEYVWRIPARKIDLHSQADILLVSVDGFVDVFELKRPSHAPLVYDNSHKTYYPSPELSKALAQAMHYLRFVNENRLRLQEDWGVPVFRPRAIIVIGRSDEWDDSERQGWRNLKTSLQNIDVLTFDEVLGRAEQLIRHYEATFEANRGLTAEDDFADLDEMPF